MSIVGKHLAVPVDRIQVFHQARLKYALQPGLSIANVRRAVCPSPLRATRQWGWAAGSFGAAQRARGSRTENCDPCGIIAGPGPVQESRPLCDYLQLKVREDSAAPPRLRLALPAYSAADFVRFFYSAGCSPRPRIASFNWGYT
jgi:hypothetical protein